MPQQKIKNIKRETESKIIQTYRCMDKMREKADVAKLQQLMNLGLKNADVHCIILATFLQV